MKDLINQLNQANHAYYVLNKPIMTDKKYDSLYDKLLKLEETTGVILTNSPTQKVGAIELKGLTKVKHSKPALSLQKTKSEDELRK
jgi:DNA ligase (NAD+)